MFNKSTESAIASMTLLAEVYDSGKTLLTATEIAKRRGLQRPFVAKILTQLAAAGLVKASPGRNGGYYLAKKPSRIRLLDIARCFERRESVVACAFGAHYCGTGPKCPLHDQVVALRKDVDDFLAKNTLTVFTS